MKNKSITIISPHIDDAVLSLGGLIANFNSKFEIYVVNVFTISNWINPDGFFISRYSEMDCKSISNLRKAEERAANLKLRYTSTFLDFLDLPLRDDKSSIQEELNMRIRTLLKEELENGSSVFFPLGIDHPDHELVATIGNDLLTEGHSIVFYEDMPYMARPHGSGRVAKEKAILHGLNPVPLMIDIEKKIEAIKVYESQVSQDWLIDIYNYSQKESSHVFLEHIWPKKSMINKIPFFNDIVKK